MSWVYGPVPSRRLGQSLGIDPIPSKSCNYNCVYCQLGRTRSLAGERRDFYPPESILAEVEAALAKHEPGEVDYITFVGQGEPLLCRSLGSLIRGVKALSHLPVAVITNGSLLWQPDVREELEAADVVMPSLDCADESTFRRINRPSPLLRIGEIIGGLAAFRQQYGGRLWVEVMLVRGMNDGETALLGLRDALSFVHPDQVHVNTPIRPPAESWVQPPDEEGLIRALTILGEAAVVVAHYEGSFDLSRDLPPEEAILEVIRRHPMRLEEVLRALIDRPPEVVEAALATLEAEGAAQRVEFRGRAFWRHVGGAGGTEKRMTI
jgi:wyosine [tRNA(Phe)-imidazoG37] synthetase (radical SAM superfamily)